MQNRKDSIKNNLSNGFLTSYRKYPERPALEVSNKVYTYSELGSISAKLENIISSLDSEKNNLVGLFGYQSITTYAGILSILAAGKGYVPLHPDNPVERNLFVIYTTDIDLIIVGEECKDNLDKLLNKIDKKITVVYHGNGGDLLVKNYNNHQFLLIDKLKENSEVFDIQAVGKSNIAYILFTSGSTGTPKGVPITHHSVISYVEFISNKYSDINQFDKFSHMHDVTFDFSIHDLYVCWKFGACVSVANKADKLLPVNYIKSNNITVWSSVPSVCNLIDKYGRLIKGAFPNIRYSFFCGEALYSSIAEKWQLAAENSRIINLYGPTETTMAISYYELKKDASKSNYLNGIVPVGKIFDTQNWRLINDYNEEVPVNEIGELCLSGTQVSKGYINDPERTKTQFVNFKDTGELLWYKTGDLMKKDSDNCLYYLGRVDHQVKISGNRVELGEIEHVIREIVDSELVVCSLWPLRSNNAEKIIAFVSTKKEINKKEIIDYTFQRLPKYMVPSDVIFLNEVPRNLNGKVDREKIKELLNNYE